MYHGVYVHHSSAPISVYTRPIAQFLVGNGPFKWPYVMRRDRRGAAGGALDSRVPPAAPVQPVDVEIYNSAAVLTAFLGCLCLRAALRAFAAAGAPDSIAGGLVCLAQRNE